MEGNSGIPAANNNIKDPFQAYVIPTDPCSLRIVPSCNSVLKGLVNHVQVLFQIKTGQMTEENISKRPPIDLAIVLDRSGSMSGEKLKNSKEAIKMVIENLSIDDKLHFVIYDSKAKVIFENGDLANKDSLRSQVDGVQTGGSTNIGDGLIIASKLLQKYKQEGHTQRIYLFSDGLVNTGLQTHKELFDLTTDFYKNHKIGTCTFGIGEDFDEDLMKGIAEYGNSYYFFIDSFEKIEKYVSAALGALLGTIAKDAHLKVRGKNGGIVKRIYGHDDIIKGASIGDIKQNNLKNILVEMEVTPNSNKDEEEILSYEFTFLYRKDQEPTKVTGTLKVICTEDEAKLEIKNIEALIALTVQQSADFDAEILKLLENNNTKGAIEIKKKEITILEDIVSKDTSGRIASLIEKAKKMLTDLETQGNSKHVVKEAKYHRNLKRYDSADFMALQ